jgi:hypothetical protein
MTISDYQVSSVIKTYMRNMKVKMRPVEASSPMVSPEDRVLISEEAMKRMLFDRIGEKMTEKLRRYDHEE